MKQGTKKSLISSIIVAGGIGAAGMLLNQIYPITFTVYFIVCVLSLLICGFIKDRLGLIIPWTITATASVLITINYLYPDTSVYSNADFHVLALQGVNKQDSIVLVGKDKKRSFYDEERLEGYAVILASQEDDSCCVLNYQLTSEPLYMAVPNIRTGKLINKNQLPSFKHEFSLQNDSVLCKVDLELSEEKDTVTFHVNFKNLTSAKEDSYYTPGFHRPIQIGYNLYDILHNNTTYKEIEEQLLQALRNISIVRNIEDRAQHVFYLTYNSSLEKVKLCCDSQPVQIDHSSQSLVLYKDSCYYIGYGANATRPIRAYQENGTVCLRYQFPYLNNFPRISTEKDFKENTQKTLAVTCDASSLLKSNVNEAFYYPLFENSDNKYKFGGNVNFWVGSSRTPFSCRMIDNAPHDNRSVNKLKGANGAEWLFETYNLRQQSPITGQGNIWVQDTTIMGMVFLLLFLSFAASILCSHDEHRSVIVMAVWLFAVPLLVLRVYLLWRIAVFPPVTNISLNEFLRYRMELPDLSDNPMIWTLGTVAVLFLFSVFNICPKWLRDVWKKREKRWSWHAVFYLIILGLLAIAFMEAIHIKLMVGTKIVIPVIAFLINEYIALRWLSIWHRIGNALAALLTLFVCDPGYAIMFFIFECFYFSVILYALHIRKPVSTSRSKMAGIIFQLAIVIVLLICIIWLPKIVACAYSNEPTLFQIVSKSRLTLIILPLVVGGVLLRTFSIWQNGKRTMIAWGCFVIVLATILSATWGYDYFQNENLHFKYRAIIHTQTVGEIMQDESYDHSNSQRLLNAAQNQWFLQYHFNKGKERIDDEGIVSLLPHFKKGVTWNTQISDVILSRYVIGELSGLVPLTIILFTLVFLGLIFKHDNKSPAGKALTFAVGLLFVIQTTFVWMAVTNRTIFFGQDFPFLSQNARFTLVMFGIWLVLLIYFASHTPNEYEDNQNLRDGLRKFAKPLHIGAFFLVFTLLGVVIVMTGNKYAKLYANQQVKGDKNDATAFNLSEAIDLSSLQLQEINAWLSKYSAKNRKLESGEDLSNLVDSIENSIHLSDYVEKLKEEGKINDFTFSLYQAFTKNLKRSNSNSNIIHLRHHDVNTFELGMNKGFFSLQSPDFDKQAWRGNVYTDVIVEQDFSTAILSKTSGALIYTIPQSWLPPNSQIAIIDNRTANNQCKMVLHKEEADYNVKTAVFPITPDDMLEMTDNISNHSYAYQFGKNERNLMVKNMIINGRRKFFYPLEGKCMWLRGFANIVAKSQQGTGSKDPVFVTLDYELTKSITDSLIATGAECSVVALDGYGNVRLMADNKLAGMVNPNNEDFIEEQIERNYLNPSSVNDQNLFGNLNLCYMNPGPGSSLKPITYAAVTSQSQDIDWAALKLLSPSTNDSIATKDGNYLVRQFGPEYKYPVNRPFRSIAEDEKGQNTWIDNHLYLSRSSNYYNALITYLGLYDHLGKAKEEIFVRSHNPHDFPRFTTGQGIWTFGNAPTATANQILFNGLTMNFRLPTFIGWDDSLRYEFIDTKLYRENNLESKTNLASSFSWVFPQSSTIYDYEMRSPKMTPAERLRQYTLGAPPIKVTPIKMAEMYGKLFSLHRDYHATIMPHYTPYKEWWLNSDGVESKDMWEFYRDNLYAGMALCTKSGTAAGTLKNRGKGYFLYAKTGTLNISSSDKTNDDKMLAVIICNKDILSEGVTSSDDYKFFVVYFRYKQTGMMPKAGNIIDAIINSKSFNHYMKQR